MNRYPSWLNTLVVLVFITGFVFALPNVYSSLPSVQIANSDGSKMDNEQIDEAINLIRSLDINPVTECFRLNAGNSLFDVDVGAP